MRLPRWSLGLVSVVALFLVPLSASAQNTSSGSSAHLTIGQIPVYAQVTNTPTDRWFDVQPRVGRSYCASATTAEFETGQGDPVITVYQSDGTTVIAVNDDVGTEPDALLQSRACWIQPQAAGSSAKIKVSRFGGATAFFVHVRVVETTLFGNHFFIGGDYGAYSILRNTTTNSVSATVTWRNLSGTSVGTTNVVVPANGGVFLNARDFVNAAVTSSGNVEIAHTGSEQALVATSTTLSATTGLSFDTIFFQRQPW